MNLADEIYDAYFQKIISKEKMKLELGIYEKDFYSYLLSEIEKVYISQNSDRLEKLIWTLDVWDNEIDDIQHLGEFCSILNKILICNWHNQHGTIVNILEKISNLSSLEYLYKSIDLKLDYLAWDDNYAFEVKCVRAMYYIGKEKSISYLKKLCYHPNVIIREIAQKQIKKNSGKISNNREIRALYTDETIRVYQAYNRLISDEAVKLGKFGNNFKMDRMTWLKTSFLWMMYRCGWAQKEDQEFVLAIDIQREGFDFLVKNAVSTAYKEEIYGSQAYWNFKMRHADALIQWDPERDIYGNPLDLRTIQLGLRGESVKKYVDEWIVSISDITNYVLELKKMIDMKQDISAMLPKEIVYCEVGTRGELIF